MEFEESPVNVESGLVRMRAVQDELRDALVPLMTGLIQITGWMDNPV